MNALRPVGEIRPAAGRCGNRRPLIAHVVLRFDYGGLENGVVNLINGLPEHDFRHTVIALTEATAFSGRIRRNDVSVHMLKKRDGKDPATWLRLYRLLRMLRPDIVHTRNLATIEGALIARLAGVPRRIHGEHGWGGYDPDGANRKYRALRRAMNPLIHQFVAVSAELEQWLVQTVGIHTSKVMRICNGVDTERFTPRRRTPHALIGARFPLPRVIVGSVTSFSTIKDPLNLVRAFITARREAGGEQLRLVMLGDGTLRNDAQALLADAALIADSWLPGRRDDVAQLLCEFDMLALGSTREGIPNVVLEAMASGLPVIATATGGNLELLEDGVNGRLVPPRDSRALVRAILDYASSSTLRAKHGAAGRARAVATYSLRQMLAGYRSLYNAPA